MRKIKAILILVCAWVLFVFVNGVLNTAAVVQHVA